MSALTSLKSKKMAISTSGFGIPHAIIQAQEDIGQTASIAKKRKIIKQVVMIRKRPCPSEEFAMRLAEMLHLYQYEDIHCFEEGGIWCVSYEADSGKDLTPNSE